MSLKLRASAARLIKSDCALARLSFKSRSALSSRELFTDGVSVLGEVGAVFVDVFLSFVCAAAEKKIMTIVARTIRSRKGIRTLPKEVRAPVFYCEKLEIFKERKRFSKGCESVSNLDTSTGRN